MTEQCIAVHPDTTVDEAVQIMSENKIRRLCVVRTKIGGHLQRYRKSNHDAGRALNDIFSDTATSIGKRLNKLFCCLRSIIRALRALLLGVVQSKLFCRIKSATIIRSVTSIYLQTRSTKKESRAYLTLR